MNFLKIFIWLGWIICKNILSTKSIFSKTSVEHIQNCFFQSLCVLNPILCKLRDIKHLPKLPFFPFVQHSDQRDHNDDRWQGGEPLAGGRLELPVQNCSRTQTQISRYLQSTPRRRRGPTLQNTRAGERVCSTAHCAAAASPRSLGGDTAGSTTPDTTLQQHNSWRTTAQQHHRRDTGQ